MSVLWRRFSHCSLETKDMKPDSQLSRWFRLPTFLIVLVWSAHLYATTFISTQSGNWSNPATWGGAGFPGCSDTAIVSTGTTVTQDATNCSSDLTVNGILDMANQFFNFEGTTFTNNGAVISSGAGFGEVDFNGVGGATGTTQHVAGTGTYNTTGRVDFHSRQSGFVVPVSGTVLNGVTNWTVDGGSTLSLTSDFVVNGLTVAGQYTNFVNGGTISGTGVLKAHNNVTVSGGGAMSAPLEVVTGTTVGGATTLGGVTVDSGATLLEGGTMKLLGDLTVLSGGTMDMANQFLDFEGTTFTNNGAVISSGAGFGEVDFNGVGNVQGTTQLVAGTGTYNTTGRVDFHSRQFGFVVPSSGTVLNGVTNWTIDGGSTLSFTSDFVVNGLTVAGQYTNFVNGGTISGTGVLKAHNNVTVSGAGTMSALLEVVAGTTVAGTTTLGGVTVDSGATLVEGGTMKPLGDLTVLSGGTMDMANQFLDFEGTTFTNNGAVISSTGSFGEVDFNGVGNVQGTTQLVAGTGTYNTNGQVHFHVRQFTSVTIVDGALVDGIFDHEIDAGSTLTNNGTMGPGFPPGQAIIDGNLQLGPISNLSFDIGGTTQGTDYDLFDKTDGSALTLNGDLVARLINNFTPSPGDTFTIYQTLAPLQGAFSNVASGGRLNAVAGVGSFVVSYAGTNNVTLSSFGPTVCVTPPPDMISWWPGDGNADDIRGGNNGTLQDGATFAQGLVDDAFSFNVNGYVQVAYNSNLDPTTGITVDAWVNPSSQQGPASMVNHRPMANNAGYTLEQRFTQDGTVLWNIFVNGNSVSVISNTTLPLNTWTHIAGTFDGTTSRLYFNGVEVGNTTQAGTIDPSVGADFEIGRNIALGELFDGLIDEVELFSRALTPAEIQSIYNAGSAGKCKTSPTPSPTPTPTATSTPTSSPTPTATPTPTPPAGRSTPTPRPRPTPLPRPGTQKSIYARQPK
jgi:hypothetical protein